MDYTLVLLAKGKPDWEIQGKESEQLWEQQKKWRMESSQGKVTRNEGKKKFYFGEQT